MASGKYPRTKFIVISEAFFGSPENETVKPVRPGHFRKEERALAEAEKQTNRSGVRHYVAKIIGYADRGPIIFKKVKR